MLAVAGMAMAGCAKQETLRVAENRIIGFDSFVGKPTKAVTPVTGLSNDFYVFGNYGPKGTNTWTGKAFQNELNTAQYFWVPEKTYRFGAYANGSNGKIENAAFDAATKTLTFPEYTPDDTKDLVAAVSGDTDSPADPKRDNPAVPLTFKHMLSQVKLTFTTDAAATYQLTVTDVKIEGAHRTATGKYSESGSEWVDLKDNSGYGYDEFGTATEGGKVISSGVSADQVKFIIPQAGTETFKVGTVVKR